MLPVEHDGWDNHSYRHGADMSVRLPRPPVTFRPWTRNIGLPVLARSLPVPGPVPLAAGHPGEGYPFPWSVRGWLGGHDPLLGAVEGPNQPVRIHRHRLALAEVNLRLIEVW